MLSNRAMALAATMLYALERLAQHNPAQRQTIVDLLCAYLRMPSGQPRHEPVRPSVRLTPPAPR